MADTPEQPERRWRIHRDTAWVSKRDVVIVLPLVELTASPLTMQESSAIIWDSIAPDGSTESEIVAHVAEQVDIDPSLIKQDVIDFLEHLGSLHILTIADTTESRPEQ